VRGLFAFLDPLLGRAALVVEPHDGATRQEQGRCQVVRAIRCQALNRVVTTTDVSAETDLTLR
jgi:hypothetical protein